MQRPLTSPPPADTLSTRLEVETPEHVVLEYTLAGVGSRLAAAMIDLVIVALWGVACLVAAGWTSALLGGAGMALWFAVWTTGFMGYFTLFEAFRQGQTPGKRALGIRVVRDTGHGVSFGAAATRNLLRAADFLPPPYLTGLLLIMLHPKSRRLGDIVAGTVVVRDRPEIVESPRGVAVAQTPTAQDRALVGPALGDTEWRLLTGYRERAGELEFDARVRLEEQLVARFAGRYPVRPVAGSQFLDQLYRTEAARRAGTLDAPGIPRASASSRLAGRHGGRWSEFERMAQRAVDQGLDTFSARELPDFAARYREVAADLARIRTYGGDGATRARLERLAAAGHNVLYRDERRSAARIAEVILRECPAAVWTARRTVALALACLFGPAVVSYTVIRERPALAYEVLPDVMIERAEAGQARQADDLGYVELDAEQRPLMAAQLIHNNVRVAFNCFAGGLFLGIGSLTILAFNGLSLGASAGHYANVGLFGYLFTFIVGHGVLELFAIAVSGAAGFLLGMGVIAPGELTRSEALVTRGRVAIRMIGVVVVLLVIAGLIEGLASASGASFAYRLAVSSASAVFLLLYLANGARWAGTHDAP